MSVKNSAVSNIQITTEVISSIAAAAALDVEGVAGLEADSGKGILGFFRKKNFNGIEVKQDGMEVSLGMNIIVYFGCKLNDVGAEVQKSVKTAVEKMAGIKVKRADINIVGIENPNEEEPEIPTEVLEAEEEFLENASDMIN